MAQALRQSGSEYEALGARQARRWRQRQRRNYAARQGLLRRQRVGRRLGPRGLRDRRREGPRRRLRPQLRAATGASATGASPASSSSGSTGSASRGQAVLDAFAAVRASHPAGDPRPGRRPPAGRGPRRQRPRLLSLDSAADRERQARAPRPRDLPCASLQVRAVRNRLCRRRRLRRCQHRHHQRRRRDAIGDGGLLVDPADMQGLRQAMLRMCDPETARELGERAFAHAAGLSWQKVAQRLHSVLRLDRAAGHPYSQEHS